MAARSSTGINNPVVAVSLVKSFKPYYNVDKFRLGQNIVYAVTGKLGLRKLLFNVLLLTLQDK